MLVISDVILLCFFLLLTHVHSRDDVMVFIVSYFYINVGIKIVVLH